MLKLYCYNCGTIHSYSSSKPNFCTKCGQNLNKIHPNEEQPTGNDTNLKSKNLNEDIEENVDFCSIPKLDALQIDILKDKLNTEKISDIINSSDKENFNDLAENFEGFNLKPDSSNENFLKNFAEEAGALRPKTRTYKNNVEKK